MKNNLYVDYSGADTVKKKSKGAIIGIGAIVLVGVATLSYMFIPQVKNAVRLATLEPNEYLQTVTEENLANVASAIAKNYASKSEIYDFADGTGYEYNLSLSLSDEMVDDLGTLLLGESETMPSSFVSDYTINGHIDIKDTLSQFNASILAGDSTLLTTNVVSDIENEKIYFQIPEMSSSYLYSTPSEDKDDSNYYYYNSTLYDMFMEQTQSLNVGGIQQNVSAKDIENTINKYAEILVDNLTDDTTLEKGVTGNVLSVEYEYNKLSTTVTAETFSNMCNQFIQELQYDDVVKTILVDGSSMSETEYSDIITEFQDAIDEIDTLSQDTVILDTYVNSMGIICGIGIGDDDDYFEIMFAYDGTEYALNLSSNDGDSIGVDSSIGIYANEVEKDTFNGNITIDYDSETFMIQFSDVIVTDGKSSGTFTMDLSSLDNGLNNVTVNFDVDSKSQTWNMNFSDLVTVDLICKIESANEISIPTGDMFNYDNQFYDYYETVDEESFMIDILTKVGLYDWYQEQMSSYYNYDYDYGYNEM